MGNKSTRTLDTLQEQMSTVDELINENYSIACSLFRLGSDQGPETNDDPQARALAYLGSQCLDQSRRLNAWRNEAWTTMRTLVTEGR